MQFFFSGKSESVVKFFNEDFDFSAYFNPIAKCLSDKIIFEQIGKYVNIPFES